MAAKIVTAGLGTAVVLQAETLGPQTSDILNFISLLVLVGGLIYLPRALRAKGLQAELAEKDRIIATRKELAELAESEAKVAREKNAELGGLLDHARSDAATWQARYEEQQQYTAGPALTAITTLLEHTNREAERRHKEILLALRALRTLGTAAPMLDDE